LLGRNGELRRRIQEMAPVRIVDRGAKVVVMGEESDTATVGRLLEEMLSAVRNGHIPDMTDVTAGLSDLRQDRGKNAVAGEPAGNLRRDLSLRPRTTGQAEYLNAIQANGITMAIGPAGTGKTYLAMAAAVAALLDRKVNRIILTRPAVEAGESLGFLPGDLQQKVNPYLRPLYDALYSMVDTDRVQRFIDRNMIEVAPLAFMRGRTLDRAFMILDEAQNTTPEQMKMFLTRFGEGSTAVITGDITQIDLPRGSKSGLIEAERILRNTEGIAIIHLTQRDIVRHKLVQSIVDAYAADDQNALSQDPVPLTQVQSRPRAGRASTDPSREDTGTH
jgi:phosphate starvation-inducible PhoH-like protein